MPRQRKKKPEIKKGYDSSKIKLYASMSGYEPSLTGAAKAFKINYQNMCRRDKNPDLFTKKEMDMYIKNTGLSGYEILQCFHADSINNMDERAYYADHFMKLSQWLREDMNAPHDPVLRQLEILTEKITTQAEEITKLQDEITKLQEEITELKKQGF